MIDQRPISSQKLLTVAWRSPLLLARKRTHPTRPGFSQVMLASGLFFSGSVRFHRPPEQVAVELVDDHHHRRRVQAIGSIHSVC